ncbi:oxysterol-binding -related 8 isoform X6 [Micractinium conductrix]|uniref:Oxysterol-binding -related 8 isoform X6 n=1 Tax=Micractinium conductrix TaxID=554055 RepID=A0A2P6VKL9_9CHLO|nr:oxysterol-binding -related 8 isoform X6 [Micractinium conductrix]|eukprot:PSC74651.1 oxysterol-binding -related 8 isoform X6 [Micractinium conductrix]
MLRAERAPDPLERMLAVCRVVLCLATDLVRPGRGFGDTPTVVLGQHYLSRRQLGERHRGDTMQLFLQELASHEPLGPTQHPKYTAPASSAPPGTALPAPVAATLSLRVRPTVAARQQPTGLLAQLGGGSKVGKSGGGGGGGADGAPPAWLECSFEGHAVVTLLRHAEEYRITLPSLVLTAPLAEACPLDFSGAAVILCEGTGLAATLRFAPFKGGRVTGSVATLLGGGHKEVASIGGSWLGTVTADSEEGSGVLWDAAAQSLPPATVNLAQPGPRAFTRLWTAILEAAVYVDATTAAKEGKRAAELAAALPAHMRHCLLYAVESSGLKSKQQQEAEQEAEIAAAAAAGAGVGPAVAAALPPCVLADHAKHGTLTYQIHYRVQPC